MTSHQILKYGIFMISLRESIHEAVKWGDDHYDRLLCPGLQPSQSKPRGSGPEVLKGERGHVTSETGVAEVAVFGALQPNVSDYRYWHYQKILQRTSRNFQRLLYRNSNQKGTVYFNVFFRYGPHCDQNSVHLRLEWSKLKVWSLTD